MSITIEIPKELQKHTNGAGTAKVDNCHHVFDCIKILIEQYPGLDGEILDKHGMVLLKWMIYINHESPTASEDLLCPVKRGDVITFLPMIAGG